MRLLVLLLTAVSATAAAPAIAQTDSIARGPAPDWVTTSELLPAPDDEAGGLVFVRRQDTLVHLDESGQTTYLGYRVKLLHPNALQLGNVSIVWNPAAGPPMVHALKIHRGESVIDVLPNSTFEVLRREDQLEAAILNGVLTAVLKIPDLRVGDELELAYSTPSHDPTLGAESFGLLGFVGPDPAPGRFRTALSWEGDQQPAIRVSSDLQSIAKRGSNVIEFSADNLAPLTLPKDAPPRFAWQRMMEFSDFNDWQAVSRRFAPLYAKAAQLKAGSPLKQEAATIAAAHQGRLARASAALKLVQQEVRYIYIGLNGGNLTPEGADETWQRRYGDCKAKTTLLLALLNELGIEAHAVVVSNSGIDDGLDERLPNPGMFDHVLVRAVIDGTTYWLDGTLPPVATPSLQPTMPYRWILPLTAAGSAIQALPWTPQHSPTDMSLYDIDASAGFDVPAAVTTTSIARGIEALQQQVQFSGLTRAQLVNAFRQQLVGASWDSVEDVEWRYDVPNQASVLKITGTWTLDWDDDGDGEKSLSLPGGGFSPPERRLRASEQDQNIPFYETPSFSCHVTTVRLPSATRPENWSFNSTYDVDYFGRRYHRAFERRAQTIRMIRGSRTNQPEITAAAARQDNARIPAFDNSMAWIYYKPGSSDENSGGRVPSVDEVDWVVDQDACLDAEAMN